MQQKTVAQLFYSFFFFFLSVLGIIIFKHKEGFSSLHLLIQKASLKLISFLSGSISNISKINIGVKRFNIFFKLFPTINSHYLLIIIKSLLKNEPDSNFGSIFLYILYIISIKIKVFFYLFF